MVPSREQDMDRETNLIVIGAGGAGLTAALTAAEAGLSVLLLEKEGDVGGSTLMSGGSFALAGTDIQEANGIADTAASLFDDLRRYGGNENVPDVVRAYTENQAETYAWLRGLGAKFAPTVRDSPGNSVKRTHTITPSAVIPLLAEKAKATGLVETVYGARAWKLNTDPATGRVTGVDVEGEDPFTAHATHGVIVASGGFTRAAELIKRFAPSFATARVSGGKGNTGDGLLMAWKLGADLLDVGHIQGNFGVHPAGKSNAVVHPIYRGGIVVNKNGNRYVNEAITFKMHSNACMAQPGKVTYQIFDQGVMNKSDDSLPTFSFKSRVATGDVLKADTLAELAGMIGVPPENLASTIERYNTGVDGGIDRDFGRTEIAPGVGPRVKIETAPFYAFPSSVVILGTYCGIRVDGAMRVIDVLGMEIEGLFAAGEVVGGFHGHGEIPGAALGKAFIFGRVAAKSAVTLAPTATVVAAMA
jgi:fumarate reductase flavoprotein subunit